ncbi:MAG: MMPL family transporter [Lachnospiraceae bacterium]|nr:MMPL family transporter [Lachnospiraceae bacterium]
MIEKFAHGLTRKPALIAVIALALLVPSAIAFLATPVNYDILTYLPEDLDSTHGMDLLEEPFHMAATSMLIVENMPSGYTNDLTEAIQKVPGVSNAVWLSNAVGVQIPTEFIPQQFREMFYSGEGTMMIIQYEHPGASDETMNAIRQIRSLCNEKCFLAGFSVVIRDTRDLVDQEMPLFVGLAVLLALIAMSLTMESWILPFVLLVNIGIAVVYNFGTNFLAGQISYITKAIAAVLQLGVTMDYSVFLYHAYEQEKPRYEDHKDAMAAAVATAFRSLTGSSLTTIAGFLALCFMRFTLGKDIGVVMAKGVVLGVATVILVLPSLLLLADKWVDKWHHKPLLPDLTGLNRRTIRHRWVFVIIAALLFVPSIYAKNNAAVYYKLDESLPQDLPSIVANQKLKEEFDMSVSHFAVLADDLTAAQLSEMEARIEAVPGVTSLVSYHKLLGSGIPEFFVPEELRGMVKADGYQLFMINSAYDTASDEVSEQVAQLREILKEYDEDAMLTGEAVLTDDLIDVTAVDFKTTNYISMAAIFLIIAIVFKSVTVPLVLVAVIELAIFVNLGIPYFTGNSVAFITPTVISCVQLGATVDYAILMTSRFQDELRAGKDRCEAALTAASASDPAIITSSLVMFCATLGVSFISSIDLIGSICTMLARGSVISAVMSIVFLPAILCACEPLFRRTSYKWLG